MTAAPKFLDISADANSATIQGVQGAVQAATQLVRSRSRIAGNDDVEYTGTPANNVSVTIDGATIDLDNGFPAPHADNILAILDVSSGDFVAFQDNATDDAASVVWVYQDGSEGTSSDGSLDAAATCYVEYDFDAANDNRPTISIVTTTC